MNWGSDHPALLEEIGRVHSEGNGKSKLQIVTCPNEMVALSAAQGFAQTCGYPAAVLIHVDVGTQVSLSCAFSAFLNPNCKLTFVQALAGAVHNADRSRVPVLIYAGASPFTSDGEMKGSRNEWIMWLQGKRTFSPFTNTFTQHHWKISMINLPSSVNTCAIRA